MKITSSTLKRLAVPALVAGLALPLTVTSPAAAAEAGAKVTRYGGTVTLNARTGVKNTVTFSANAARELVVRDGSGLLVGPGCRRVGTDGTTAVCGSLSAVTRVRAMVRDGDDSVRVKVAEASTIDAGNGRDLVQTGAADDTINVRDGEEGDRVESCGGGAHDTFFADAGDIIPMTCENRFFG
ncbi:hypothetical protein E2C00_21345 [Streptomyces sp. WAC05374]|uniref:hypothetical protein n=1 Tax=unclassified Streptomyces TaxID=2593676 RepID=UPI000F876C50|nr:hypothetical protein [Streptomyces sp. WAC05374]RST09504.1 hypothetical protein EF905_29240 [Streptomyces sp. WAC05374]TDF43015.1 hypothetical protein E2B92_21475 [Streptomyces sp. WAC05374]TDF46625.1 hypothetical protein E2C02_31690 [Streptomyces sp. WAC05374]TDF53644.1 hypothetical protein E2C00_21345 [Streptomyces sp. WAC05374]